MKRVVLIAKGEVQRVGYRDEVERLARTLNLCGYVENSKPHDVMIVAEGKEATIDRFIELVKINRFPIYVKELVVQNEPYQGDFEYFEIRRGEWHDELSERMDIAGKLLYRSVEVGEKSVALNERSVALGERSVALGERSVEVGEKSVALNERSVALGERSVALGEKTLSLGERSVNLAEQSVAIGHQMLEKQDRTIAELRTVSQKIDQGKEELVTEIKYLREDIKVEVHQKLARIEDEIAAIKMRFGIV
jgi:acylphosphatase/alpha-D-ribose 1-methylphosphonate 5-triphosphate synthase subunit PhnG